LTRAACTLLGAAAVLAAACSGDPTRGYAWGPTYRPDVSTVAVEILSNETFERGAELALADALVKEIESRTPYTVTSSRRADTILTGRIRAVDRTQLSKSPLTGLSEEVALSVTIDLQWRDLRTGKPILDLESFTGQGLFVPSRPTGEPIELGRFAAVQKLARDIVDRMQAEW
jgi:hypothetical protein